MKPTPRHLFVDNNVYGDVNDEYKVWQMIAASIKAIYILVGEFNLTKCQDPVSLTNSKNSSSSIHFGSWDKSSTSDEWMLKCHQNLLLMSCSHYGTCGDCIRRSSSCKISSPSLANWALLLTSRPLSFYCTSPTSNSGCYSNYRETRRPHAIITQLPQHIQQSPPTSSGTNISSQPLCRMTHP